MSYATVSVAGQNAASPTSNYTEDTGEQPTPGQVDDPASEEPTPGDDMTEDTDDATTHDTTKGLTDEWVREDAGAAPTNDDGTLCGTTESTRPEVVQTGNPVAATQPAATVLLGLLGDGLDGGLVVLARRRARQGC